MIAILIGLALGLAFVSPSSAVVGPAWSAGSGHWPTVVVSPTGAVAAWVTKSSAASPDNRVVVCKMNAGGSTCAHKTTLAYNWGPIPQIVGDTRPALQVLNNYVRVAVAGSIFPKGEGVAVWTSIDGGVTFKGPVLAGTVQENLGGLQFSQCGLCQNRLYAWTNDYAGGAMVSILDPTGPSTLGTVVVDKAARFSTPGGGLAMTTNGDLFLVAQTSTEVRVYRVLAADDPLQAANWKRVLAVPGEELSTLWTEGFATSAPLEPKQYLSLVTNRASDGAPRVRRWTGSAFSKVLTVAAGSGYKHPATAALDGAGRTWVFNTSPDSKSLIVARPVTTTAVGAFTRVVPYVSAQFNITGPAASLGGNGYGLYGYVVDGGGGMFTQRFVALKVPHTVSLTATKSATPHRYTLKVTTPKPEQGAKGTFTVTAGGKTTTLTGGVVVAGVLQFSVRPTIRSVYRVSVKANGWWTARTVTITLNPR